jgi:L-ascorbate metabolism protein UlaG (beta-lactamase superfamily)
MKELGIIDIAFIPMDGTFTMNMKEAIQTAITILPHLAIPIDMGKSNPE